MLISLRVAILWWLSELTPPESELLVLTLKPTADWRESLGLSEEEQIQVFNGLVEAFFLVDIRVTRAKAIPSSLEDLEYFLLDRGATTVRFKAPPGESNSWFV